MRNLEDLVRATCLRRTKVQVQGHLPLPPRVEEIEWIDLNPSDRVLYEYFKAETANIAAGSLRSQVEVSKSTQTKGHRKGQNLICLINILRLICGHGEVLLPEMALKAWQNRANSSTDWQTMQQWGTQQECDLCSQSSATDGSAVPLGANFLCQHVVCSDCLTKRVEEEESDSATCPICEANSTGGIVAEHSGELLQQPAASSNKVLALVRKIREEQQTQMNPATKR